MTDKQRKRLMIFLCIILVLIILFVAASTAMERGHLSFLEKGLRDVMAPLTSGSSIALEKIGAIPQYFVGIKKLSEENENLKTTISQLETKLNSYEDALRENVELCDLLELKNEIVDWSPIATKVIGRSSSLWYNTITIKGGSKKGFEANMICVTAEGLVGRITAVSAYTSEVRLITDRSSGIGALVQVSNSPGVVSGLGRGNELKMVHIPGDARLVKDQVVVTSGLGEIFPAGLRIGYIGEVKPESNGLMLSAIIKPFVDFDRLDSLLVLTKIPAGMYQEEGK